MKKLIALLAVIACVAPAVFAAGQRDSQRDGSSVIRMGDNHPDRSSGMGLVMETINAEFLEMNPGTQIEVESLPDQPWQEKVRVYAASRQMPDIFKYWSYPAFMRPLIEEEYLAPLNRDVMDQMGYMQGSLENNTYNGELYGIPVSADLWVIYYNEKLFNDAGVSVPRTIDELLAVVPAFREMGIAPIATNGMDAWPLVITYDVLVQRYSGDFSIIQKALDREASFTDKPFLDAARLLQNLTAREANLFQEDLMVSDYGAARNLFGQGRAAMYIMGSWEMGLATDENFSSDFRENVKVMRFPVVDGGRGGLDDLSAWYGGNLVVGAGVNSEISMAYIEYFAERFPDLAWELQATFPAQEVQPRDSDTELARLLLEIAASAQSTSGTPSLDRSDSQFKDAYERLMGELCVGIISPEQFVERLDREAAAAHSRR